ncbi:hypothetical protein FHL15_005027 [Xylaria flabelliformis]|uniref:Uncharacterized protein n=1 Tax=Xylaria flabelliformis TaxID=2512241 RepID=A0A553I167_9PEZI|nr:hypothetical protein FHL15_005027 [Xylaria flabelliformis]
MCILYYYICSKCYCGYPRYTRCCRYMHPPLVYCPQGTEFKFHVVEEQECHLYPHHTVASHFGVNGKDAAFSVSSSASVPPSEEDGTGRCTGKHTSSPSVPKETTRQLMMTDQQSAAMGRLVVNGSSSNQKITPSQFSNDSHKLTTNTWNRQAENIEIEGPICPYNQQQSSFNGYRTNSAYSGAPFDYRYHSHSDPLNQYYPYQQAPMPAIEYHPQTNLPIHVYMEVEGPGRYSQSQGSAASATSHFGYSGMFPERMYGRNISVPETNPLRCSTTLKSSFNPQAASFNYGKANRNPLSNPQAVILDSEAYKSKCRKTLEQLKRSNRAAYYNRDNYDGNQGAAISDDRNTDVEGSCSSVENPESSTANGGYSAANAEQNPCSRSRSWSEPGSQQVSMSEVSSLSHQDHESNDKGKGKEVMRNPSMSWSNMSMTNPSTDSIAKVENRDVTTQTDDHPVRGKRATSFRYKEVASLDKANSHEDLATTDSAANSDSTNLGIVSVKTESGDEDCKVWHHSESTPIEVKTDPDDDVKLHNIPSAPASQRTLDSVRSDDSAWDADIEDRYDELETPSASPKSQFLYPNGAYTPKSASECESQPIKLEDTTPKLDVQRNDKSRSGTPSTHRSASNVRAPSDRSWSAVVSGRYIPSKASDPCPPQPATPTSSLVPAAQTIHEDEMTSPPTEVPKSCSLEPIERTSSPDILNVDREHRSSSDSYWASQIKSLLSHSDPAVEETSMVRATSENFVDVAESTTHRRIDGISYAKTFQPDLSIGSSTSPSLVAPTSPMKSTTLPRLPESAPSVSTTTSTALESPKKPQPRSWSQVLGGSKFVGSTKSDSSMDEASWPSLGSGGPSKGPKRNTTS